MDPDFWNEPNVLRRGKKFLRYLNEKFPAAALLLVAYSRDPIGYEDITLNFCKSLLKSDPEAGALFVINMLGIPYPGKRVDEFIELLRRSVEVLEGVYERTGGIGALLELCKAYSLISESLMSVLREEEGKEYAKRLANLLEDVDLSEIRNYNALDEIAGFYHFLGGISPPEEGIKYLTKAIKIRERLIGKKFKPEVLSKLLEDYLFRGYKYELLGELEKALRDYERVEELLSKYRMTDTDGVRALAGALMSKSEILYKKGEFDEAEEACRNAIRLLEGLLKLEPNPFAFSQLLNAYEDLLSILFAKGRIEEGIEEIMRKIEELEKEYKEEHSRTLSSLLLRPEAYVRLGSLAHRTGLLRETVKAFTKAIERLEKLLKEVPESVAITEIYPRLGDAYVYRGDAYKDLGDLERGMEDITKGVRIFEKIYDKIKHPEVEAHLAVAYMYLGNLYKRMFMFERAIEEYDKALKIIRRAIEKKNRRADRLTLVHIYINKAFSLLYLRRYEEVERTLKEAEEAIFNYGTGVERSLYYLTLAACDIASGRIEQGMMKFEKALENLKKAYDGDPVNVINAVMMALSVLKKIGIEYPEEAIRMLKRLNEVPLPESIKSVLERTISNLEGSSGKD